MRAAILFLIFFSIVVICVATSFFLLPDFGQIPGLAFALLYVILVGLLGDKWVISKLKASKNDTPSSLRLVGDNVRYCFNMDSIDIYITKKYRNNIYIFQTTKAKPILIIGDYALSVLNQKEIESMVYLAFSLLAEGKIKYKSWVNFLLFFFEWPKSFLPRINTKSSYLFSRVINFYLFPFKYLRYFLLDKSFEDLISGLDKNVIDQYAADLKSLYFKITNLDYLDNNLNHDFINNFVMIPCARKGFLEKLIFSKSDLSERFQ